MSRKKKDSNIIEEGTYSFYFTGEGFTNLMRDYWNSNLVKLAITAMTEDCGIPIDAAVKICTGKLKCTGDTRVGDHTLAIEDDDATDGIYFSLESQVKHVEKQFLNISQRLSKLIRKFETYAGTLNKEGDVEIAGEASIHGAYYRKEYAKRDKEFIEEFKKDQKKYLENLEILYPLVGKKMSDLPVFDIGTELSDIEIDHYQVYGITQTREERTELNDIIKAEKRAKKDKKEKKVEEEDSYDQGEDESDEHYTKRMTKLAKKINPIEDIKTTQSRNGWISPQGEFYNVEKQPFPMHINAASDYKYLGIVPDDTYNESEWLDNNDWMKMTGSSFYKVDKLTQGQIDMFMDYMSARNLETVSWFDRQETLKNILKEEGI